VEVRRDDWDVISMHLLDVLKKGREDEFQESSGGGIILAHQRRRAKDLSSDICMMDCRRGDLPFTTEDAFSA